MVHWVYVLQSSTTGAIYVGETVRLYRRWNEHTTGRGGATTSRDVYDTLIGLYHVGHNWSFLTYRSEMMEGVYKYQCAKYWDEEREKSEACTVENHITEQYRVGRGDTPWWNVRGGKYCKEGRMYDLSHVIVDRPRCRCGYPCEVKLKNDQTKLYFTCPVPSWTTFEGINVPSACSFWEEFKPYRELRESHLANYTSDRRTKERDAFAKLCDESGEFTTSSPAPV